MIRIYRQFIGQPQQITDEAGIWRSAIFRTQVDVPLLLEQRGLVGDQVADTKNHGTRNQAICAHPLAHYEAWNSYYKVTTFGPGSVGENWTIEGALEADICVGDTFQVGGASVQVSAPRYPCSKQEKKVKQKGFHSKVVETLRTGFYLRVLSTGLVAAGDQLVLQARPHPEITIQRVNEHMFRDQDPVFAKQLMNLPELATNWKMIIRYVLKNSDPAEA